MKYLVACMALVQRDGLILFNDQFFQHASAARSLIRLMDGHSTHYQPEVIWLAKDNSMEMLVFPQLTANLWMSVADLEGVPWVPWNPPFCRQLEDQPAHGTVFSQEISVT